MSIDLTGIVFHHRDTETQREHGEEKSFWPQMHTDGHRCI